MQENTFTCYGRIMGIKPPQTTANSSERGDPLFNITATLRTICGTIRDGNKFNNEVRDVEVVFSGIGHRQIELLAVNSEIMIYGATVITTEIEQKYPINRLLDIIDTQDSQEDFIPPSEIANFLADCVVAKTGRNKEDVFKQISLFVPEKRKSTVVRVKAGQWSLKASERQITGVAPVDAGFDSE